MVGLRDKKVVEDLASDRLVLGVAGLPKRGKTHLAMTFPEPIFLFNFDKGLEGTLEKFEGKEIYYEDYEFPSDISPESKRSIYDQFLKDYWDTLINEDKGTIVIDTFSHVWDLIYTLVLEEIRTKREAHSGKDKVYPFDYANANAQAESILRAVYRKPELNMVVTQRLGPAYDENGNEIPGKYKAKGYKGLPYTCTVYGTLVVENRKRYYRIEETSFIDKLQDDAVKVYNPTFESIQLVLKDRSEQK